MLVARDRMNEVWEKGSRANTLCISEHCPVVSPSNHTFQHPQFTHRFHISLKAHQDCVELQKLVRCGKHAPI